MSFKKYLKEIMDDPRSGVLNFWLDGRLHYVYRISKDNLHYYGSKTDEDELTIGCGYYTSSYDKKFREEFKANPEKYKIKVVSIFTNRSECIIYESYLHQKFNVKDHPNFINRSNQTPWGFDTTGLFKGNQNPASKGVYQIDTKSLTIVARFVTLKQAAKADNLMSKTNANAIGMCARGKNLTAGGYAWIYVKDFNSKTLFILSKVKFTKNHHVFQWNLETGEFVEYFENSKLASEKTGVSVNQINGCSSGRYQSAGNSVWTRAKNPNRVQQLINSNHNPRIPKIKDDSLAVV